MLSATVAALACLCLARSSPADHHTLRAHTTNTHGNKELGTILASIEERLRVVETISLMQAKQARRLDVIQDKLDRIETTISLKLERAQLAAERLEHRIHILQTNIQATIKENSEKVEKSQEKIVEIAQNLTEQLTAHTQLLEKVSGSYADTWRRGLLIESMVRDSMSLVNVTRRELADGLRALARRQRDSRLTSADLEIAFSKRLHDTNNKIDLKMQEVLDAQKHFVDSCQRVQLDDPTHVADVLDKLINTLINKIASTFQELQSIQSAVRSHDNKVVKLLTNRPIQTELACKRMESIFRNSSRLSFNEKELQQLTEKFIALTNKADAALQKLEARINDDADEPVPPSDVTAEADKLLLHLNGIRNEENSEEDLREDEDVSIDGISDLIDDVNGSNNIPESRQPAIDSVTTRPPHRRHLHKHPYDRGPKWNTVAGT